MAAAEAEPITKTITFNSYTKLIDDQFNMDKSDVHFVITSDTGEITVIPVHKTLLSILSPSFCSLFDGIWKEKSTINLPDVVSGDSYKKFLQFFYKNAVEMNEKNVYEILYLAKEYEIDDLIDGCLSYMMENITVDTVVASLFCASIFQLDALRVECTRFISENTGQVLQSQAFLRCKPKQLKEILAIELISCSEVDVFDACMEWAKQQCDKNDIDSSNLANLRKQLDDSFHLIRFTEIDRDAFNERRNIFKKLFSTDELLDIFAAINVNASNANSRQVKMDDQPPSDGRYLYDFKQIASAEFGFKTTNVLHFGMSKAVILTAIRLSNIFIETTDDRVPFPYGVSGSIELHRMDLSNKTLITKWDFVFKGDTTDIQIDLQHKQILHRNQIFELNITAIDERSNGHKFINMYQMDSQCMGGIKLNFYKRRNVNRHLVEHGQNQFFEMQESAGNGIGTFVSGLRFEKFDINSLKLLELT